MCICMENQSANPHQDWKEIGVGIEKGCSLFSTKIGVPCLTSHFGVEGSKTSQREVKGQRMGSKKGQDSL